MPQTNRTNRSNSQHASAEQQREIDIEREGEGKWEPAEGAVESISISDCGPLLEFNYEHWAPPPLPLRGNKQMYRQQTYVIFNNKATVRKKMKNVVSAE